MQAEEITGHDVLLVPVAPERVTAILSGELDGRRAGRGWPHADTPPALSFAEQGGSTWLVVDDGDVVVGELGTKAPPDTRGRVEIGYALAARSRGHGLGTRAVRLLVEWLRTRPEVTVVEARVLPGNEPSVRLLRRLGFVPVGSVGGEDVYELPAGPP